jgi:hypothetical protein
MILLLALAAATAGPLIVDIAGMPPQLEVIRNAAVRNGWKVTCEGRSGEEGVIRLSAPSGESSDRLRAFVDDPNRVGSGDWVNGFGGDHLTASCDHEPPVVQGDGESISVLEAGLAAEVGPALEIATACGYANAVIRPWLDSDMPGATKPASQEWVSLDAGPNASSRYGPLVCFMQMRLKIVRAPSGPVPWSPPRN